MLDVLFKDINTSIILCSSITAILIFYWIKNFIQLRSFFKKKNLPSPRPLPIIGNLYFEIIKHGFVYYHINIIKTYGKMCGYFEGSNNK